jgi:excinuclease ABC subunit A
LPHDDQPARDAPVIAVRGAAEHNLKHIDVTIPRGVLAVVTGVSGSGKSSLAFDTICAEGRRRYLQTFSSYARQFLGKLTRPAVTSIDGLSPAVAVDQSAGVSSPRSTVGTMTELYDLLRLLWARAGIGHERTAAAPATGAPSAQAAPAVRPSRALFSFNSPHGACPECKGLGIEDRLDPDLLVKDAAKSVREGALRITTPTGYVIYSQVTLDVLGQVCRAHGFTVDVPWRDLTPEQRDVILNGSDRIRIPYGKHPLASRLRWSGITAKPREEGVYKGILPVMEQILRAKRNRNILRFVRSMPCRACGGTRLRPEALAVKYRDLTIAQAAAMSVDELRRFFEQDLDESGAAAVVARQAIERCRALQRLGLGYLALDRESSTLSAGEAQRIRLARQASIGLGGLLYVLDEPSIGQHHHDTGRLLDVLRALRDRGNTVLVVEHDEQVMRQADWLVDIGPAAGDGGGRVLFNGPSGVFASDTAAGVPAPGVSPTRAYLTGAARIELPAVRRMGTGELRLSGITRHNLHALDVQFKLGALNVVTGVSGAGKSTLVEETVRRLRDEAGARTWARASTTGIDKIIAIDQAPIGRTPRSNPATYTGLFDAVRDLFAATDDARARGFGKGRFSFNVAGGRCEACEGAGVQQIGMQFLGTVAVVCDVCGGRRFNEATLEVRYRGKDIHEVLEMPVDEAAAFFEDQPSIFRTLDAIRALGLGYIALGHPATMLSGGEAQRVKLATELARPSSGRTLYVLDEPTTGLHAADVALLLRAIDGLVARGNTVIAIEHHLDVIKVADWLVDLGPGSGADGGRLVTTGTPEVVAACPESLTGRALLEALEGTPRLKPGVSEGSSESSRKPPSVGFPALEPRMPAPIRLTGVTTHNLQHIDVEIPSARLTVITGVSGSGKSSLAFDTLFAEAQQRYAETFSTWARRFVHHASEAEFERAQGLTPAVAIGQQRRSRNPRSTVATLTEIHDLYRLLFARAGTNHTRDAEREACDASPRSPIPDPPSVHLTASMFSPNSERGACPQCRGLGHILDCDPARLVTDASRPLAAGAMDGHKTGRFYGDPHGQHMAILQAAGHALEIDFGVRWQNLDERAQQVAMRGAGDRVFDVEWHYRRGARTGVHRFQSAWPGLQAYVRQEYERKHADRRGEALEPLMVPVPCQACGGARLKPESLAVRFAGLNIAELLAKTVTDSLAFFQGALLPEPRALLVTSELRADIVRRLQALEDAALGYLSLDRAAATLSSGEAQRARLASQLGSGLTGITYVLDEPTAGLHPRDTARLIGLLRSLASGGNTVVVVEHDADVIAAADHVIEVGPGAGDLGGRIVSAGPNKAGGCRLSVESQPRQRDPRAPGPGITIRGALLHNLRDLDIEIPSRGLVAITGVSGSGKSSLVFDVLAPSIERVLCGEVPVNCREVAGALPFTRVVRADRGLLVGSPWSTPATLTGIFDTVRGWFAATDAARARGLRAQHFSTTVKGGRCEACEGLGRLRTSMDFLPDVWTTCEQCHGTRYGAEALACTLDGRSVADVLAMSVDALANWLSSGGLPAAASREVRRRLDLLRDIGLGYLQIGQPAATLSGGERQRLALVCSLMQAGLGPALYLLDEPTTGLHARDVAQLLRVFDHLIDAGHTVVVIEHHLDVIANADWVIDLGPEGGPDGGTILAAGPPDVIASSPASHTGLALRRRAEPRDQPA